MSVSKDQYFTRNATGIAMVEFCWGLGFPVVMESTFLQIFLKNLGASDTLIGLVPGILMAGISVCPLASAYLTRNMVRTRGVVLSLHLITAMVLVLFGAGLFFLTDPAWILPAFFAAYVLFSMAIGFSFPVWLNFLVKIFSPEKNVKGLAYMYLAQNVAKILASLTILKVVADHQLSHTSSAAIFLGAGLVCLMGSFGFLITREIPEPDARQEKGFLRHLKQSAGDLLRNRNLVRYLLGDLDTYVVITVIGFYANYAVTFFQVSPAVAAGLFVSLIYTGSVTANLVMGTWGLGTIRQKYLATKALCALLLILLIVAPGLPTFLVASQLMGFCRATRNMIYSPTIKQLSGRNNATAYFALAPLLTMFFSSGYPLFFGRVLDQMGHRGAGAYQIMFGVSLVLVVIIAAIAWKTQFRENGADY